MDIKIRLRHEMNEAFANAVTAASMIGYATSGNERDCHKAALSKALDKFSLLLSHIPDYCDGTPEDL